MNIYRDLLPVLLCYRLIVPSSPRWVARSWLWLVIIESGENSASKVTILIFGHTLGTEYYSVLVHFVLFMYINLNSFSNILQSTSSGSEWQTATWK